MEIKITGPVGEEYIYIITPDIAKAVIFMLDEFDSKESSSVVKIKEKGRGDLS